MKTVVLIQREGKVKGVSRRALATVPAPASCSFCLNMMVVKRHTSGVPQVIARTV
jgi:hypothetical protein